MTEDQKKIHDFAPFWVHQERLKKFLEQSKPPTPEQVKAQRERLAKDEQDCNEKCCSPFFSCNTCAGFVLTTFNFSVTHSVKEPQIKIRTIAITPVSDFPFSVWHPPQFV